MSETKSIKFKCYNNECQNENTYHNVEVLPKGADGSTPERVFRCKNCNTQNKVIFDAYHFAETHEITRGHKPE